MTPAPSPSRAFKRLLLLLSAGVIAVGLWPAIALLNRAQLVLGLPVLAAWACLIPLLCTALMLLANRLTALPDPAPTGEAKKTRERGA